MAHIQHPYLSGSVGLIPDPRQRYRIEGGYIYTERLTPFGFRESGDAVQVAAITGRRKPDGFISSAFNHGDLTIVTGNRDWVFERVRDIRRFLRAIDPEKPNESSVSTDEETPIPSPKDETRLLGSPAQQPAPASTRPLRSKPKLPRARRFKASSGGLIEDQLTGLCWMADPFPADSGSDSPAQFDWNMAARLFGKGRSVDVPDDLMEERLGGQPITSIEVLGETDVESGGSQDWRLPTSSEFFTLVRRDGEFEALEEHDHLSYKQLAKSLRDEVFCGFPDSCWCSDERYVLNAWAFVKNATYRFKTKRKNARLPVILVRNS